MTRINDRYRECVSQVRKGGFCAYSFETLGACVALGLLSYESNGPTDLPTSYDVTVLGAKEADAWEDKRSKQKARASKGAKIRRQIMRDMGITGRE